MQKKVWSSLIKICPFWCLFSCSHINVQYVSPDHHTFLTFHMNCMFLLHLLHNLPICTHGHGFNFPSMLWIWKSISSSFVNLYRWWAHIKAKLLCVQNKLNPPGENTAWRFFFPLQKTILLVNLVPNKPTVQGHLFSSRYWLRSWAVVIPGQQMTEASSPLVIPF